MSMGYNLLGENIIEKSETSKGRKKISGNN